MKLELRLPQQDVEADVKCYDANGKEVKVAKIVIEPIFHQAQARVPILYATTTVPGEAAPQGEEPKDEIVQGYMLLLSGTNGKTQLVDRSKRVKPQFEAKRSKPGARDKESPVEPKTSEPEPSSPIETIDMPDTEAVAK